jgi:hypothetical protein
MPGRLQFLQLVRVTCTAHCYKLQQIGLMLCRDHHVTVYQPPCILQAWISNKIRSNVKIISVITRCHKQLLYPVCSILKSLVISQILYIFFWWHWSPMQAMASSFMKYLDHTQWHTTVIRTPLDSLSQKPLPDNTQHSQDRHPWTLCNSNPWSQQVSSCRPAP